ncbi:hypothetical protein [Streptomyces sp. NBC_01353]|uniref:hypothetical protein n=1 Tax=Streptomyces sp. NBC_01353 TaxID=2903835 RepID=UPI002E327647|nr:hypothetical protein [Streptomyces sp. NBC_01353]
MTNENSATPATRLAIELLTVWREQDRAAAAEHVMNTLGLQNIDDPTRTRVSQALAGLLNLSMITVAQVGAYQAAQDTGRTPTAQEIEAAADSFIRSLSLGMPD